MFDKAMFQSMNKLGAERHPFVFVISYDQRRVHVFPDGQAAEKSVYYSFPGQTNSPLTAGNVPAPSLEGIRPVSPERYREAFAYVVEQEKAGNSYLVNLTFPAKITCSRGLYDIYVAAKAMFKLYFAGRFCVFSPERFVRIERNEISTCPMKGTISAGLENAGSLILEDSKELAEHVTVVDLLRNDLGRVGKNVRVGKFRYIDEIPAAQGNSILQVSSLICADLGKDWHAHIGDILIELLPAGSVTGAPKKKTCEIIRAAEQYDRGYYTGIMGYYDGNVLDSAVMIRFIEDTPDGLVYKSGGGITIYSDVNKEYKELLEKIYVPVC
ncbi:MAG: aminodeoxychorismate synthase component I [Spirochaetales bacterium]|nr:aminodeoxychorismate synthase component I [Spirochaetales bacterium]